MRSAKNSQGAMLRKKLSSRASCAMITIVLALFLLVSFPLAVLAHPLGNFTINHFARIEVGGAQIRVRYVIDMAEIPTFQELQGITANSEVSPSKAELNTYADRIAATYVNGLVLTIDDAGVPLKVISKQVKLLTGGNGMPTMRFECDLTGDVPATNESVHRLRFEDNNYNERIGWRELVVSPEPGISVFNSSAYGGAVTDELKSYPADLLAAPLDERRAELSFTSGPIPAGAHPLRARDGRPAAVVARDRFAELIAVPKLTPSVALL